MIKYLPKIVLILVFIFLSFFFVTLASSIYAQYADPGTGCGGCPEEAITYNAAGQEDPNGAYVLDANGNYVTYDRETFDVTQGFTSQVGIVTT